MVSSSVKNVGSKHTTNCFFLRGTDNMNKPLNSFDVRRLLGFIKVGMVNFLSQEEKNAIKEYLLEFKAQGQETI